MSLDPRDLNLRSESDAALQTFQFDSFLDYWRAQGNILSWSKGEQDERGKIKAGFPAGLARQIPDLPARFPYPPASSVSRPSRSENLLIEYDSQYSTPAGHYRETLTYSPYTLSLSALHPSGRRSL